MARMARVRDTAIPNPTRHPVKGSSWAGVGTGSYSSMAPAAEEEEGEEAGADVLCMVGVWCLVPASRLFLSFYSTVAVPLLLGAAPR